MSTLDRLLKRPVLREELVPILLDDAPLAPTSTLPAGAIPAGPLADHAVDVAQSLQSALDRVDSLLTELAPHAAAYTAADEDGAVSTVPEIGDLLVSDEATYISLASQAEEQALSPANGLHEPDGLLYGLLAEVKADLATGIDTAKWIATADTGSLTPSDSELRRLLEVERTRSDRAMTLLTGAQGWRQAAQYQADEDLLQALFSTLRQVPGALSAIDAVRGPLKGMRAALHHGLLLNAVDWRTVRTDLWGLLKNALERAALQQTCALLGQLEESLTRPLIQPLGLLAGAASQRNLPSLDNLLNRVTLPLWKLRQRTLSHYYELQSGLDAQFSRRQTLIATGTERAQTVNALRSLDQMLEVLDSLASAGRLPTDWADRAMDEILRRTRSGASDRIVTLPNQDAGVSPILRA